MNKQKEIFPETKHIPQWLADYFHKANAGKYAYKQMFYKHIKEPLLKNFADASGYDLQVIQHKCWSCKGTGIYEHCYYECGFKIVIKKEPCWNCKDGIYTTKTIMLERFILNGRLYHIPLETVLNRKITHKIEGLITHPQIDPKESLRGFLILLWFYNKPIFYHYIKELTEKTIKSKASWVNDLIQSLIRKDNTADELPF